MTAPMDRYAASKETVSGAIEAYLDAAVAVGSDDAASTLELARQILLNEVNAAVDQRLLSVPLTEVWTHMTSRARPTDRTNGAGT